MKDINRWNAFCTVSWFATGQRDVSTNTSRYIDILYSWFMILDSQARYDNWWKDSENGV